jgi:hypothetical protein
MRRFHCEFQGISSGWSNVDLAGPDCQWVDFTDVEPSDHRMRITVSPDQALPEEDDSNNTALLPVHIPAPDDVIEPCPSFESGAGRDCGWEIAAGYQSVTCPSDETVTVGCGGSTGGVCESDWVLRVCAGDEPCVAVNAIDSIDDTFGRCPEATFTCPAGGTYTVLVAAFSSGSSFVS